MTLKQKIYGQLLSTLEDKAISLKSMLNELREGSSGETKSSAGDKHETARAMAQIEQEHTGMELRKILEQKAALEKIDISIHSSQIIKGSLIKTDQGYVFLSIAFGRMRVDDITVIVVSPQSPLGRQLIGLKANESICLNKINYCVENID